MLVLSRRIGERILIDSGIEIAIVDVRGSKVRIGVEAPLNIRIRRAASPPDSDFAGTLAPAEKLQPNRSA